MGAAADSPLGGTSWSLEGRVALVTGAAGDLGQAICETFRARGATVFGVDIKGEATMHADLSTVAGNSEAVDAVVAEHGGLEILVLNAGLQRMAPIAELPAADWHELLDVLLSGPFHAMQRAWPHLTKEPGGRVLVTASTSSFVAESYKAAYVAAKHGVLGLVKVAAMEGATQGLTANAVAPGWMWTGMAEGQLADRMRLLGRSREEVLAEMASDQPAQRLVKTEEVAATLAFLACPVAAAINGVCVPVDLGALA